MSTATTEKPSQSAFETALREHLTETGRSAVPNAEGIRRGIDLAVLDAVREHLGLSHELLERTLCVSTRTLQRRRRDEGRLTPAESDRLWRLLHVYQLALNAFGGREDMARTWLTTPKPLLAGESPLDRLDTEPGLREVEDMLTVIDETAAA